MEALFIDIDNDGDNDLYVVSGGSEFNERSENLKDRIYLNDGNGNFSRVSGTEIDLYTISGKTVTKIDYDNDGDYDLIVGNRIKPQKYPLHEISIIYERSEEHTSELQSQAYLVCRLLLEKKKKKNKTKQPSQQYNTHHELTV